MGTFEIIFLVLDIIELILVFILSKVLIKTIKEYKRKCLVCFSFGAILAINPTLTTILLVIFVVLFLTICELAYKIHEIKNRPIVKEEKKISIPYEIYQYEEQKENIKKETSEK